MADDVLGHGPTAPRLLALLTSAPGQEFHTRDLVRRAGGTPQPVHAALTKLERRGVVSSRRLGNLRLWRAVPEHPLYGPLRDLTARTVGVAARLRDALTARPGIELAFIFGSYSRGDDDASSDIDLFILGDANRRELDEAASEIVRKLGRQVNTVAYTPNDVKVRLRKVSPFIESIFRGPKVWLIGGESDLERRVRELGEAIPRPRPARSQRRRPGAKVAGRKTKSRPVAARARGGRR